MLKYKIQVSPNHYLEPYDSLSRFISYYYQKDLFLKYAGNPNSQTKTLEIGIGSGFLKNYLHKVGYSIKTFDIDKKLKPDFVGDLFYIDRVIRHKKYEIILGFEVFEHISFNDIESIIAKVQNINSKYLIISVPQIKLYISFWIKVPIIKPIQKYFCLPFPKKHVFKKDHYWELGYSGYSLKDFVRNFEKFYILKHQFTAPLIPYYRYFVFMKK